MKDHFVEVNKMVGAVSHSFIPSHHIAQVSKLMGRNICHMLFVLSLAACSTPAVKDRIVVEKVPVAVQPIKPADIPKAPAPLPSRPESLSAAADVLLSKVCELEAYVLKTQPLLQLSAGVPITDLPRYQECGG